MPRVCLTDEQRKEAETKRRNDTLARRLRTCRAAERINQDELAARAGCSRTVISHIENSRPGCVTFDILLDVIHAAKMPAEEWLALGGYKGGTPS